MSEQTALMNLGFTPERFPPGTHVCLMFGDEVDRRSVIHPYVRAGLREDDDVFYFADALVTEILDRAIDERSVASLTREQLSRLSITSVEDTYFPTGTFVPEAMIDGLEQLYKTSRDDGASGCRVSGEMAWALRAVPGADHLVKYESEINTLVRRTPMIVLCQYDTEQFDGETLFRVLSVHPHMIVRGQIMHNPCYVEPEEFEGGSPDASGLSQETILARLYFVQLALASLPDDQRIADFVRCAFLQVPGIEDVHFCLADVVIPPDGRYDDIAHQCARASSSPNSFDVMAIEEETGSAVFVLRTTTRLFGVVLIGVKDEFAFSPYRYVLANIANAIAMALDARHSSTETHVWPERVANLERRLWRIAREFEGAGVLANVATVADPYSTPGVAELSPRQWEVLTRLLQGERVPRIADELYLSQSTVRNHLADMFKKMGVHSQEELLDLFRSNKTD
ncbi:MAG TPA: MEDS domain-containing protein [Acidimicrobiales bacterium]|jgi:DNA-binding CsgD family transcriptional regulator|nr:MEDS domain-containing protein [Acidimicrobiales bacterium]